MGESPEDELRALRQQLALLQAQVNRARQGQGEMGEKKGKEGEQPSVPALEEEVKVSPWGFREMTCDFGGFGVFSGVFGVSLRMF